jgi:hypothetical protein
VIICLSRTRSSAELLVSGIGPVVILAEDHEIRPVSPAGSLRILTSLYSGYSQDVVDLLNEVEIAAALLFEQASDTKWLWEIHGCPNDCQCHLEVD